MGGFGTFSSLHHGVVEAAFVKEKMLEPRGRPKLHHSLLGPAPPTGTGTIPIGSNYLEVLPY